MQMKQPLPDLPPLQLESCARRRSSIRAAAELPDGDIPIRTMFGPVVLEVHRRREIMAFSC